ncbi:MAG: hypothetical protein R3358_00150 [Woeseiaceae bacterium]|nr:hypothetical protein [Woeseiaceae bacterium]
MIQRWAHMVTSISELPKARWIIRHLVAEQALSEFRESLIQAKDGYSEDHVRLRMNLSIDVQSEPHFYLRDTDEESIALFVAYPGVIRQLQDAECFSKNHGKETERTRANVIRATALRRPGTHWEKSNWRL